MKYIKWSVILLVSLVTIAFAVDQVQPSRPQTVFVEQSYYDAMFGKSPVCQAFVSESGAFLAVNPAICKYLGYTESALLRKGFREITHPSDVEDDANMAEKVAKGVIESYTMKKTYLGKYDTALKSRLTVRGVYRDGAFVHFYSIIEPLMSSNMAPAAYTESIPPVNIKILEFFSRNYLLLITWVVGIFLFSTKRGVELMEMYRWYKDKKGEGKEKDD